MTNKKYVVIFLVCLIIVWVSLTATYFYGKWLDFPYMTADNPDNPGRYGGLIITNEVNYIADSIVDKEDTPHEKVLKDMAWVNEHIEFKSPPQRMAHPNIIIESGVGLCGDYAIVTASLLACQDVPSRIIGLYNKTHGAHVVIEAYYEDDWHLYDPTFEAYWIGKTGDLYSFEELLARPMYRMVEVINRHNIPTSYYLSPNLYIYSDPAGVIGPEYPMWWELEIETEYIVSDHGYKHGSDYIGATYLNNCHNWTITNLTPGKEYSFVIYPKELRGIESFILYVNETACEYHTAGEPVYINFTAHNETENLHVWHPYTGREHIYMMIEKYDVIEMR